MVSAQDVLITFKGKDEVSHTTSSIKSSISHLGSTAGSVVNGISDSISMLDSQMISSFGSTTGKTFGEEIFGTSKTAETNKVLIKSLTSTEEEYNKLYDTIDTTTNNSLVSMQNLIPAMSSFQAASGATADQLNNDVVPAMADFGQYVLALGNSEETAQTAMSDLGKGLQGQFAALDEYRVSEESLEATGLWSGKEDDIEGYMAAVEQVIGNTDELMNTTSGLETQMNKMFSKAGKDLGGNLLPLERELLQGFMGLNTQTGGMVAQAILAGGEIFSVGTETLGAIGGAANGVKGLKDAWNRTKQAIHGTTEATEEFNKAQEVTNGLVNGADVGADVVDGTSNKAGKETAKDVEGEVAGDVLGEGAEGVYDSKRSKSTPDMSSKKSKSPLSKTSAKTVTDAADDVGIIKEGTSKLAPEAVEASAGAAESTGALSALSASISSMLVPLLAVAAVVAIMIPIVVGLAAEALVFIRMLGTLIEALDFDSLDLSGAINGLKQIGSAMWELTVAFGEMTLVGIETAIYSAVSRISGITNPVKMAVSEIKKAVTSINQLAGIATVNSGIPAKLQALGTSLHAVSMALFSMMGVTATLFVGQILTMGGLFGNLASNLKNGLKDIRSAVTQINNMKNLPTVNSATATKLKALGEALKGVSDAVKALSGVTWEEGLGKFISSIGNMKGTMGSLEQARGEIYASVPIINSFASLPNINKSAGTKLKAVADALDSVSKAVKSLGGVSWDTDGLGSLFTGDVINSLSKARTKIGQASVILSGFSTIANIPGNVTSKVTRVGNSAKTVINAIKGLNKIKGQDSNLDGMTNVLQKARTSIGQASVLIAGFSTIANIPTNVATKLNKVSAVLPTVKVTAGRLKGIPTVPNTANIKKAVKAIKDTATELATLNSMKSVESNTALSSINTAIVKINTILRTSSGKIRASAVTVGRSIGQGVKAGLGNLSSVIIPPFNTAMGQMISQGTAKGQQAGTAVKNGFKTGIAGMKDVAAQEVSYTLSALTSRKSEFYTAGSELGSSAANGYKAGSQTNSPGLMARTANAEIGYTLGFLTKGKDMIYNAGVQLGGALVTGFGKPNLATASGLTGNLLSFKKGINTGNDLQNINSLGGKYTPHNNPIQHTTLNINEGAVKLDARNLSTRECKEVMINGLEGMDAIDGVLTKKSTGATTTNNATTDISKTTTTTSNLASTTSNLFNNQKNATGV